MKRILIESRANPRFKALRHLKPGFEQPLIAVEGEKLIRAACEAGLQPESLWTDGPAFALDCPIFELPAELFAQVKVTKTGQSPLALFPAPNLPYADRDFQAEGGWLLLDQLQDPGNAGALARAALAFGFRGLIWHRPCVYPFHHACIRASAGALFQLEHRLADPAWIASCHLNLVAADMAGEALTSFRWPADPVLVMGNEGHGLSEAILAKKTSWVSVPTSEKVESLNVAGAAHILMYDWWTR